PGQLRHLLARCEAKLQLAPIDYRHDDPWGWRTVVQQQWKLHSTNSWLRQLPTATRWPAYAALHRRGYEFAQGFSTERAVPVAIPNRLHQCVQPCSAQCT